MPPAEVAHRLYEAAMHRWYRVHPPSVRQPDDDPLPLLLPIIERLGAIGEYVENWAQCASDIADQRLLIFGVPWPFTDGAPSWHADPHTGLSWPQDYCFDIDYRHQSELGEIKHVWEVNRLLYLLPVAACARRRDDRELAGLVAWHVRSWRAANPPYAGVAWGSGIECAIRIVTLVALDELLEGLAPPGLAEELTSTVAVHVDWVRRFPSRHSSANNHRIAELTSELIAAARYPDLIDDRRARAVHAELVVEALRQIHADGVSGEQATGYALFVVELIALASWAAASLRLTSSEALEHRMAASLRALAVLADSNGQVVRLGDDDGSRLVTTLVPQADALRAVTSFVNDNTEPLNQPKGLTTLPFGGYTVARDGAPEQEVLLVLDHGPLGLGHLAAHGHADTLSLWVHYAGQPLVVDAGTYLYHSGGAWRDVLRSTAVHNTLTVGEKSSSTPSGAFNWVPSGRAKGRLVRVDEDSEGWSVLAEHDGYQGTLGVRHQRRLCLIRPMLYRISDELVGPGVHSCRSSLLLAPDCRVTATTDGWIVERDGAQVARVVVPARSDRRAWHGSAEPRLGWCSPTFGQLLPTWQLTVSTELSEGDVLTVELELGPGGARTI